MAKPQNNFTAQHNPIITLIIIQLSRDNSL